MGRADVRRAGVAGGFTLPELLLALCTGLLVAGAALQGLLAEARGSQRLGQRLQERQMAARALALLRTDVARAGAVVLGGTGEGASACGLAGRAVLLHLEGPAGVVTYTAGAAPSAIWRGQVLMRCGPAFGLHGEPSPGQAQNRVLVDGLERGGARAELAGAGLLAVSLEGGVSVRAVMAARL